MKFPFVIRDRNIQGNFDRLGQLLGFERVKVGTATMTFTASTEGDVLVISHGLGKTPTNIQITGYDAPAPGNRPIFTLEAIDSSTFEVGGEVASAFTGTVDFYWLATA